MRLILSLLAIAFFSSLVYANITADNEYILNHSSSAAQKTQLGTLINRTNGLLIGKYSFAVQGGGSTTNLFLLTDLNSRKSYAELPSGALIKFAYVDCTTVITSNGLVKYALNAQTAEDLLAARLPTLGLIAGIPAGTTTTFIRLTAARKLSLKFSVNPATAGKCNVYVDYVQ